MKAITDWALFFVFIIVLALFLLAAALPVILRTIGLQELGGLVDKVQNIQKYTDESITLSLPTYVESVMFFNGENGKCAHTLCKDLCTDKNGNPMEGDSFVTINIDQSAKPTTLGILWKTVTFQFNKAKADAAQMFATDMCFPKSLPFSYGTTQYMQNGVLVMEGDKDDTKSYCITPSKNVNGLSIMVAEGACGTKTFTGGRSGGSGAGTTS